MESTRFPFQGRAQLSGDSGVQPVEGSEQRSDITELMSEQDSGYRESRVKEGAPEGS